MSTDQGKTQATKGNLFLGLLAAASITLVGLAVLFVGLMFLIAPAFVICTDGDEGIRIDKDDGVHTSHHRRATKTVSEENRKTGESRTPPHH